MQNPSQFNRSNPFDELKRFFKTKSLLQQLIVINIIVFIAINSIKLFLFLFQASPDIIQNIIGFFAVPSEPIQLLIKPWTLFTYMFIHEGFFHLLFNMVMLYFGAKIFSEYLSNKKLISTYILGGIAGALLYFLAYNIFPAFSGMVSGAMLFGASASVLAIVIAIAVYIPEYSVNLVFLGRIKLKHIAIALVVIDLLSIEKGNPGGHIAHLGGALWGFIYAKGLLKDKDYGSFIHSFGNVFSWFKKPKGNLKVAHKKPPVNDDDYNKKSAERQKEIDRILEKISKSGYDSLNTNEKETLFRESNK